MSPCVFMCPLARYRRQRRSLEYINTVCDNLHILFFLALSAGCHALLLFWRVGLNWRQQKFDLEVRESHSKHYLTEASVIFTEVWVQFAHLPSSCSSGVYITVSPELPKYKLSLNLLKNKRPDCNKWIHAKIGKKILLLEKKRLIFFKVFPAHVIGF